MQRIYNRLIQVNEVVFDQADFFQIDGFTRVFDLTPADIELQLFLENVLQPWPLVDGSTVSDEMVVSGRVLWHEVTGSSGIYNVRWRPNAVGYWRMLATYTAGHQIVGQDMYAAAQAPANTQPGLKASFTGPC
jgi:hypothetical protein